MSPFPCMEGSDIVEAMKATTYLYVRVSTEEQTRSGLGIADQRASLLSRFPDGVLVDGDCEYSGSDAERPHLLGMIARLRRGDRVAVKCRDRLARGVDLAGWIETECRNRGAKVIALDDPDDAESDLAFAKRRLEDMMAEMELRKIKRRVRDAMRGLRRSKLHAYSGIAPMGYRMGSPEAGRDAKGGARMVRPLLRDPGEQALLVALEELSKVALSLRDLSKRLADRGYLSRSGRPLEATSIRRMISRMKEAA